MPQFVRFMCAGVVGFLLYYVVYWLLTEVAGVWYITATVVAFVVNHGTNFAFHKAWTFGGSDTGAAHRQLAAYFRNVLTLFVLGVGLVYVLVEYVQLWHMAAQFVNTVFVTVLNYFLARRIFTRPSRSCVA